SPSHAPVAIRLPASRRRPHRRLPSQRPPALLLPAPERHDIASPLAASVQSSPPLSPFSARRSQAFANLQSRSTVSGETLSASAVSATLSPPKKRSSTTWLFRRSTAARAFSASSTATTAAL